MKFKYTVLNNTLGFGKELLNNILRLRGIENIDAFLNVGEHNVEDYTLYDNMDAGIQCLDKHLRNGSRIVIIVDMDADGYTSASEMYLYLQDLKYKFNLNFAVEFIVHSKKAHGLTQEVMLQIEKGQYNLVIIPDASSNDYNEHRILKENSIDIIILDHHQADEYSENAIVINNQLSSKIKNKAMTGVGVVYKFNKALDNYYGVDFADNYLDLVAVGMISDYCDLRDLECRYLILKGLELIQTKENKNQLISKIYEHKAYNMGNKVTFTTVAFYMSPFINCIIRGGDYDTKVDLFKAFIGFNETRQDEIRGKGLVEMSLVDYMVRQYTKLKKIQDNVTSKIIEDLKPQIAEYKLHTQEIIILNGSNIKDTTYNRIVVNSIVDTYKKHCILLKNNKGMLMGSAAGCDNREITDLRMWCKNTNLFDLAEGHPNAFGVKIKYDNINKLYESVSKIKSNDILIYNVDGIFNDNTLNINIVKEIAKYKHVWSGTISEPLFAIENIIIDTDRVLIDGKSNRIIKFNYKGIEFEKNGVSDDDCELILKSRQNKFTIVGTFDVKRSKNMKIPQVKIKDWMFEESNIITNPFLM